MTRLLYNCPAVVAVVTLLCFGFNVSEAGLEEFTGGRPLTKERIVRDILEYYKQQDPMGIPVLDIPEPFILDKNLSVSSFSLRGLEITGLSGLRLEHINLNVTSLMASLLIRIPRLELLSSYTYNSWTGATSGDLNITFVGLDIKIETELAPDQDAKLQMDRFDVTITKEGFYPILTNMTFGLSLVIGAADTFFGTIISSAVGPRTESVRQKVNLKLAERLADKRFPEGIRPVDLLVAGVKTDLRRRFDPLYIGNKTIALPAGLQIIASNVEVSGLSSVHRTHEVSLQFIDDRLIVVLQIGIQEVSVSADVEVSASILPTVSTTINFSIDSVSIWVEVQQPADVTHPPHLRRIHITLGNFRIRSDGESTLSYLLEGGINGLPNALRNTIIKKIEPRLHQVIQRRLYSLDIEDLVEKRLQKMKKQ